MILKYHKAKKAGITNAHQYLEQWTDSELADIIVILKDVQLAYHNIQVFYEMAQTIAVLEGHPNDFEQGKTIELTYQLKTLIIVYNEIRKGTYESEGEMTLLGFKNIVLKKTQLGKLVHDPIFKGMNKTIIKNY